MDDAWVLSIPAFRWFRVDAKSDTRYSHACARVGSQMIVVGGNDNPVWNKKDPFPKGLGIFSLNSLEWKDTFEADAAKYQSPSVVRTWYNERLVFRFQNVCTIADWSLAATTPSRGGAMRSRRRS